MSRYRRPYTRKPFYDDSDYKTNALSYYDELARTNKLIQKLAERIGFYDKELEKRFEEWDKQLEELPDELKIMLQDWFDDGILAEILAELMLEEYATEKWVNDVLNNYLTKKEVEKLIDDINKEVNESLDNKSIQLTVGGGGDFNELSDAIKYVKNLSIKPRKATILLLAGYEIKKQIYIENENLRHVIIKSENHIVNCSIPQNELKKNEEYAVFYIKNTIFPTVDFMLEYSRDKKQNKDIIGFYLIQSKLTIKDGNGVRNFPKTGILGISNSDIVSRKCDFSNNGIISDMNGEGIKVTRSSLDASGSNASNSGEIGFYIQGTSTANLIDSYAHDCGHHNLLVSQNSNVTAVNADFSHSPDNAVVVTSLSSLDFRYGISSNSKNSNLVAQYNSRIFFEGGTSNDGMTGLNITKHSTCYAPNIVCNNNTRHGVDSKNGSSVSIDDAELKNNGEHGIYITHGGIVGGRRIVISNTGSHGIFLNSGIGHTRDIKIENSGGSGVHAENGSWINLINCDISDSDISGIHAQRSEINAFNGKSKNNNKYDVHGSSGSHLNCRLLENTSGGDGINFAIGNGTILTADEVKGRNLSNVEPLTVSESGIIFSDKLKKG